MKKIFTIIFSAVIGLLIIACIAEFTLYSHKTIYSRPDTTTTGLKVVVTKTEMHSSILRVTQYKQLVMETQDFPKITAVYYCGNTGLFNRITNLVLGHKTDRMGNTYGEDNTIAFYNQGNTLGEVKFSSFLSNLDPNSVDYFNQTLLMREACA